MFNNNYNKFQNNGKEYINKNDEKLFISNTNVDSNNNNEAIENKRLTVLIEFDVQSDDTSSNVDDSSEKLLSILDTNIKPSEALFVPQYDYLKTFSASSDPEFLVNPTSSLTSIKDGDDGVLTSVSHHSWTEDEQMISTAAAEAAGISHKVISNNDKNNNSQLLDFISKSVSSSEFEEKKGNASFFSEMHLQVQNAQTTGNDILHTFNSGSLTQVPVIKFSEKEIDTLSVKHFETPKSSESPIVTVPFRQKSLTDSTENIIQNHQYYDDGQNMNPSFEGDFTLGSDQVNLNSKAMNEEVHNPITSPEADIIKSQSFDHELSNIVVNYGSAALKTKNMILQQPPDAINSKCLTEPISMLETPKSDLHENISIIQRALPNAETSNIINRDLCIPFSNDSSSSNFISNDLVVNSNFDHVELLQIKHQSIVTASHSGTANELNTPELHDDTSRIKTNALSPSHVYMLSSSPSSSYELTIHANTDQTERHHDHPPFKSISASSHFNSTNNLDTLHDNLKHKEIINEINVNSSETIATLKNENQYIVRINNMDENEIVMRETLLDFEGDTLKSYDVDNEDIINLNNDLTINKQTAGFNFEPHIHLPASVPSLTSEKSLPFDNSIPNRDSENNLQTSISDINVTNHIDNISDVIDYNVLLQDASSQKLPHLLLTSASSPDQQELQDNIFIQSTTSKIDLDPDTNTDRSANEGRQPNFVARIIPEILQELPKEEHVINNNSTDSTHYQPIATTAIDVDTKRSSNVQQVNDDTVMISKREMLTIPDTYANEKASSHEGISMISNSSTLERRVNAIIGTEAVDNLYLVSNVHVINEENIVNNFSSAESLLIATEPLTLVESEDDLRTLVTNLLSIAETRINDDDDFFLSELSRKTPLAATHSSSAVSVEQNAQTTEIIVNSPLHQTPLDRNNISLPNDFVDVGAINCLEHSVVNVSQVSDNIESNTNKNNDYNKKIVQAVSHEDSHIFTENFLFNDSSSHAERRQQENEDHHLAINNINHSPSTTKKDFMPNFFINSSDNASRRSQTTVLFPLYDGETNRDLCSDGLREISPDNTSRLNNIYVPEPLKRQDLINPSFVETLPLAPISNSDLRPVTSIPNQTFDVDDGATKYPDSIVQDLNRDILEDINSFNSQIPVVNDNELTVSPLNELPISRMSTIPEDVKDSNGSLMQGDAEILPSTQKTPNHITESVYANKSEGFSALLPLPISSPIRSHSDPSNSQGNTSKDQKGKPISPPVRNLLSWMNLSGAYMNSPQNKQEHAAAITSSFTPQSFSERNSRFHTSSHTLLDNQQRVNGLQNTLLSPRVLSIPIPCGTASPEVSAVSFDNLNTTEKNNSELGQNPSSSSQPKNSSPNVRRLLQSLATIDSPAGSPHQNDSITNVHDDNFYSRPLKDISLIATAMKTPVESEQIMQGQVEGSPARRNTAPPRRRRTIEGSKIAQALKENLQSFLNQSTGSPSPHTTSALGVTNTTSQALNPIPKSPTRAPTSANKTWPALSGVLSDTLMTVHLKKISPRLTQNDSKAKFFVPSPPSSLQKSSSRSNSSYSKAKDTSFTAASIGVAHPLKTVLISTPPLVSSSPKPLNYSAILTKNGGVNAEDLINKNSEEENPDDFMMDLFEGRLERSLMHDDLVEALETRRSISSLHSIQLNQPAVFTSMGLNTKQSSHRANASPATIRSLNHLQAERLKVVNLTDSESVNISLPAGKVIHETNLLGGVADMEGSHSIRTQDENVSPPHSPGGVYLNADALFAPNDISSFVTPSKKHSGVDIFTYSPSESEISNQVEPSLDKMDKDILDSESKSAITSIVIRQNRLANSDESYNPLLAPRGSESVAYRVASINKGVNLEHNEGNNHNKANSMISFVNSHTIIDALQRHSSISLALSESAEANETDVVSLNQDLYDGQCSSVIPLNEIKIDAPSIDQTLLRDDGSIPLLQISATSLTEDLPRSVAVEDIIKIHISSHQNEIAMSKQNAFVFVNTTANVTSENSKDAFEASKLVINPSPLSLSPPSANHAANSNTTPSYQKPLSNRENFFFPSPKPILSASSSSSHTLHIRRSASPPSLLAITSSLEPLTLNPSDCEPLEILQPSPLSPSSQLLAYDPLKIPANPLALIGQKAPFVFNRASAKFSVSIKEAERRSSRGFGQVHSVASSQQNQEMDSRSRIHSAVQPIPPDDNSMASGLRPVLQLDSQVSLLSLHSQNNSDSTINNNNNDDNSKSKIASEVITEDKKTSTPTGDISLATELNSVRRNVDWDEEPPWIAPKASLTSSNAAALGISINKPELVMPVGSLRSSSENRKWSASPSNEYIIRHNEEIIKMLQVSPQTHFNYDSTLPPYNNYLQQQEQQYPIYPRKSFNSNADNLLHHQPPNSIPYALSTDKAKQNGAFDLFFPGDREQFKTSSFHINNNNNYGGRDFDVMQTVGHQFQSRTGANQQSMKNKSDSGTFTSRHSVGSGIHSSRISTSQRRKTTSGMSVKNRNKLNLAEELELLQLIQAFNSDNDTSNDLFKNRDHDDSDEDQIDSTSIENPYHKSRQSLNNNNNHLLLLSPPGRTFSPASSAASPAKHTASFASSKFPIPNHFSNTFASPSSTERLLGSVSLSPSKSRQGTQQQMSTYSPLLATPSNSPFYNSQGKNEFDSAHHYWKK